jgi:short-subunit dehydrogenase
VSDPSFAERYGPWAAVTGAAQGMGAAFAAELVGRGLGVLMVDREKDLLAHRAAELRSTGADVRELVADLAEAGAAGRILDAIFEVELGLLVSNAAVGYVGPFVEQSLEDGLALLDVNCRAPFVLVHGLLPRLLVRGRGGIVLLSSLSAMRGAPLVTTYAATKAWNLILAESLWEEVREAGVDVMAVLPGSTRTPAWLGSRPQAGAGTSNVMEPADVVREALDALGSGPSFVPGQANRDSEQFMASTERADAIRMMGEVMRAMYPPGREPEAGV